MRCSYKLKIKSIALTILFSLVCGMAEISVRAEDSLNIISETSSITPQDVEYAKSVLFPQAIMSSEEVIGVSDTSQITVGKGFKILKSIDKKITPNDNVLYFPLMYKQETKGYISIIKENERICTTVGTDFIIELYDLIKYRPDKKFIIIGSASALYAVDSSERLHTLQTAIPSDIDKMNISIDVAPRNNDYLLRYIDVESYGDKYSVDFSDFEHQDIIESNGIFNDTLVAASSKILSNYPIVGQHIGTKQYGICWAATIASIIRFEKPTFYAGYTAQNVCDFLDHSYTGNNFSDTALYLSSFLPPPYLPTSYYRPLTYTEIQTVINNIDPAYMDSVASGGSRHATALYGYRYLSSTSTMTIYYMNPATETKTSTTSVSPEAFGYVMNGLTYWWDCTVRLLYTN